MLNVITPVAVTDAVLTACNLPETDYAAWNSATSYVAGDRVILTSTHRIYEAIAANTNQNPAAEDSDFWVVVGATNRWRMFDSKLSDQAANPSGDVTCTLDLPELVDAVAFFNVDGGSVTVTVKDSMAVQTFTETVSLVDTVGIITWWDWFFTPIVYTTEAVIDDVPGFVGHDLEITISGPSAGVGEIVIGRSTVLGVVLEGTEVGIIDYSVKDRDDFGNALIVQRAFADTARYAFAFPTRTTSTVKRTLAGLRSTAAVYYTDASDLAPGTTVFGFWNDFSIPLTVEMSFANLTVEGLV